MFYNTSLTLMSLNVSNQRQNSKGKEVIVCNGPKPDNRIPTEQVDLLARLVEMLDQIDQRSKNLCLKSK